MLDPHFRRALSYLRPYWRRLTLVLVLSFCSTALSLVIPLLSQRLIDVAILGADSAALRVIVLLFVAITAAGFGLNVWSGLRYTHVSADILFDMRLALYRHLQRLSPRFYARTRFGDIMSRLNTDIGEIQRIAAEVALAWVGNVLFLVGTVGLLAYLDLRLFLLGIALLPVSVWALVHYRRKLEGRVATLRERSADIGSFLIETLQGVKLVVTANAQEREVGRFRQRNDRFIAALMAMQRTTYLSGGLPGVVLSGSTALVFLYGGQRVIDGTLTLGTLVAFMAYQLRLFGPIQALMGLYTSLATVRVSLGRVHEILDVVPEVVEAATPVSLSTARGELALDDVSFSFERGAPVLEHVSRRVAPGECLAIVGPSGSGKSTIADLVLRLLDPQAGTVTLDGHNLRTLKLADLRARVALVDQEPVVFHASVADNIRYARPSATAAEVEAAARSAGLDAFVATLPDGYDTTVGERGAAFSAGERQRVAVARALLADPAVLVLDEATAALDPQSEQRVVEGYETVMAGRTTILITHRASLAWRADRVVVIDGARVVEEGSPAELTTRGGLFAELFGGDGAHADRPIVSPRPERPAANPQCPKPAPRRSTPDARDS
ncbi:MAG: ABC transporter ATP-binding protein [Acidobacteria bacterium]|nr:MAG: ABC transporter ATP-binding protein [Acidobacteriota bacterium]